MKYKTLGLLAVGLLGLGASQSALAFAVVTSDPADGAVLVLSFPVDFALDFSEAVHLPSVQSSDFTVNGIPAEGVLFGSNTSITFHFNFTPASLGLNSMAMSAGAINAASDNRPVDAFAASFTVREAGIPVPEPGTLALLGLGLLGLGLTRRRTN